MSARQVGAVDEEAEAAVPAVTAALEHPIIRRAALSDAVRREVELSEPLFAYSNDLWHYKNKGSLKQVKVVFYQSP